LTRIVRLPKGIAEAEIAVPDEAPRYPGCRIHPLMFDAALQTLAAAMPDNTSTDSETSIYLPMSFETIRVFGEVGRNARCRAELIGVDAGGAGKRGRITLTDDAGNMCTMAIASVVRVTIWGGIVGTVISVTNKVETVGDLAARTKASTKGGVRIVDAGVDNADADTPSRDTLLVELVYSCHGVDGLSISSASRKGLVSVTIQDNALLRDGAWDKGDGGNCYDTIGVGQMYGC